MKLTWKQRFISLVLYHHQGWSEVEFAKFLTISRQKLQRIKNGRHRLDYDVVEIVLRRLGLCHCDVACIPCPHKTPTAQPETRE